MQQNTYEKEIALTWEELKDFQQSTVEFVYKKLYKENRSKFLVADEVGLGKTLIAKGLISKAFKNFRKSKKNPVFNVIYICSNQALAFENLRKLNFTKDKSVVDDPLNRLVYLVLQQNKYDRVLKFDSLTPSTSLSISNRSGTMKERAIIYNLLSHYSIFRRRANGLKWLLKAGATNENWAKKIRDLHDQKNFFRPETFKNFRQILQETQVDIKTMPRLFNDLDYTTKSMSFWSVLLHLCNEITGTNHLKFKCKNEVIVNLRHLLTKVCLKYLGADLIILDEFQRYSELLETDIEKMNPAIELAKAVFSLEGTKVLLLSATPFKPYTTTDEKDFGMNGEAHYQELRKVLDFLMEDKSSQFWNEFENDRKSFFSKLCHPEETISNLTEAREIKNRLENKYKLGIVRTERNKVSDDHNALIKTKTDEVLNLNTGDIKNYLAVERIFQKMRETKKFRLPVPIEYCKSIPFPASFSEGYQFRKNMDDIRNRVEIFKELKDKDAWLDLGRIGKYKVLGTKGTTSQVPNAKLQFLVDELQKSESWKWLWVPPTISYYKPENIFPENSEFSKTLIFSSWKMVPRAICSIISYEAERLGMLNYQSATGEKLDSYFSEREEGKKRRPAPLLTFKKVAGKGTSAAMSLFTLLYPSKFLVEIYDPEQNIQESKSLDEIKKMLSRKIDDEFHRLGLDEFGSGDGKPDERWYWAAPILMDIKRNSNDSSHIKQFLERIYEGTGKVNFRGEAGTPKNEQQHIGDLKSFCENYSPQVLGKMPEDLSNVLALMCMGSPAICFARSILKLFTPEDNYIVPFEAWFFSRSNIHFFNKPENIAVVKSFYQKMDYWRAVLSYCMEGNLQSSIDEFVHLQHGSGLSITDIKDLYTDILSLKTASIKVDDYNSYSRGITKKIRTHYSVDFGTQDLETESGTGRIINVRQAFNSPYRPFILASTSIGQEGLDFHYYCSRVIHWNLPSNAIDIEQREGRINRYKSLTIRRNIVRKYLELCRLRNKALIWNELFKVAFEQEGRCKNKCDLVPFWYVEPLDDLKIERIVPLYPYSKDIQKYKILTETLTYYRLTFGQPRQEELVESLYNAGLTDEQIKILRANLLIDLAP